MTDAANVNPAEQPAKGSLKKMLPLILAIVMLGAGFASTFLGLWSPGDLLKPKEEKHQVAASPQVQFVGLPPIVLTLSGPQLRTLVMSVKIETDMTHKAEIEHLMPRLSDAFNSFLSDVDPTAFEKRGILDIVRDELATRAVYVLGKDAFSDILITEFRIQ